MQKMLFDFSVSPYYKEFFFYFFFFLIGFYVYLFLNLQAVFTKSPSENYFNLKGIPVKLKIQKNNATIQILLTAYNRFVFRHLIAL